MVLIVSSSMRAMGANLGTCTLHVARGKGVAEFWLDPVRIQRSNRLRRPEILRVQHMIEANHKLLVEAWNDYLEN